MRIGEFARRAGVSASKVRFYEARGVLPPAARSATGYRRYEAADLRILALVDQARELGFTLADVARFMRRPAEARRSKAGLAAALTAKLTVVDAEIARLADRRGRIEALLAELGGHASAME